MRQYALPGSFFGTLKTQHAREKERDRKKVDARETASAVRLLLRHDRVEEAHPHIPV